MFVPFTLLPSEWLRREVVLLYPSTSMFYNAKRSNARVNGPPFHTAEERDSSVTYSYRNPASLRRHLDSLTQTLQVIARANDFEEFTHFQESYSPAAHVQRA